VGHPKKTSSFPKPSLESLAVRDKKRIWHPFTQEQTAQMPMVITKGWGSYLWDERGKTYLDLISSWWVNLHGHSHPSIAQAIYHQACTLEHIIFAGATHEPAVQLCELLAMFLPDSLERFFFSDNGSTSVEVALKMAYQYWNNLYGQDSSCSTPTIKSKKESLSKRNLFLSFEGGYHGDTFGAMAVGAKSGFHDHFKDLCFSVLHIPFPATWMDDQHIQNKEDFAFDVLKDLLKHHQYNIAALIVEPLVQGASGMRMCRPEFLRRVIDEVRKHHILVIFDEVMTGFGRTGTLFALEQIERVPDFLCLSKGITGGFLPLALTITTNQIYQAFLNTQWSYAFAHGHSYTANPLACRAAIASMELLFSQDTYFKDFPVASLSQENLKKMESCFATKKPKPSLSGNIQAIHKAHTKGLAYLKNTLKTACQNNGEKNSWLIHVPYQERILGSIAAFEVLGRKGTFFNQRLKDAFLEAGLLLRPLAQNFDLPTSSWTLQIDPSNAPEKQSNPSNTPEKQSNPNAFPLEAQTIYLLPPYSTTAEEIHMAYEKIAETLKNMS
jgi:adenosylmethionine---8-amino-7-oxononanoate aminotransferase